MLSAECPSQQLTPERELPCLSQGISLTQSLSIYYHFLFLLRNEKRETVCRFSLGFLGNTPWNGVLRARIWLRSALGRMNGQEDWGIAPQKGLKLVLIPRVLWGWDGPSGCICLRQPRGPAIGCALLLDVPWGWGMNLNKAAYWAESNSQKGTQLTVW